MRSSGYKDYIFSESCLYTQIKETHIKWAFYNKHWAWIVGNKKHVNWFLVLNNGNSIKIFNKNQYFLWLIF